MVLTFGNPALGSTTFVCTRPGSLVPRASYCFLILTAASRSCACERLGLAVVAKCFGAAFADARNTKTLDPPDMSLTGTRSWAGVGNPAKQNAAISKPPTILRIPIDSLFIIFLKNY